jgi:hypothetical protein
MANPQENEVQDGQIALLAEDKCSAGKSMRFGPPLKNYLSRFHEHVDESIQEPAQKLTRFENVKSIFKHQLQQVF